MAASQLGNGRARSSTVGQNLDSYMLHILLVRGSWWLRVQIAVKDGLVEQSS